MWRSSEKRAAKAASAADKVAAKAAPSASASSAAPKAVSKPARSRSAGGASPTAVRWEIVDLVAVLAVLFVAIYAKDAILSLHAVSLMPFNGRVAARVGVLAAFYAIQFGLLRFLASRRSMTLLGAFGLKGPVRPPAPSALSRLGTAALVVGLFVGVEAFSMFYGVVVEAIGWAQPDRLSSDLTAVFGGGTAGVVLSAALVVVVAPLAEEFAFRGVALGALGERWGMWPAILGSAALYAFSHLNAWMFLPTVALGVALGWLTWSRRSLAPAIALHVLYNCAAVVSAFVLSASH
ncbi:MAG: lysostaphin resistance A-like protein [Coriobacteriia bacterium]